MGRSSSRSRDINNRNDTTSINDENPTMSPSRRRVQQHSNEETTPLTAGGRRGGVEDAAKDGSSSNYATFHPQQRENRKSNHAVEMKTLRQKHLRPKSLLWEDLCHWFSEGFILTPFHHYHPTLRSLEDKKKLQNKVQRHWWMRRWIAMSIVAIAVYIYCSVRSRWFSGEFPDAEWSWDHNVYSPHPSSHTTLSSSDNGVPPPPRNLLIAQVTGSNTILKSLGDICSRPNRAYARQWGRDYVRFSMPAKKLVRFCFDKVVLLSSILERQQLEHHHHNHSYDLNNGNNNPLWLPQPPPPPPRVVYDVVALFPPDAIITDLDQDLLNLLPEDKLLAIAGWDLNTSSIKDSNFADVLLFNLKHKYAGTVIPLWRSMVEPPVTCGAGNDVSILLHAVEAVLAENEDLASVVTSLTENRKGMIASNAVRVIPMKVPGHKAAMLVASHSETRAVLHTTADSVCYRYYPKCEVF